MPNKLRPLWRCPKCGERFVTRNMWHSCGKQSLESLFANSEAQVFKLFKKFSRMVKSCGRVRVIPQKSRIVFQVRVRFAGCYPRKSYLLCGIALRRRHDSSRFVKIEEYAPHFIGHYFRVYFEEDLDSDVQDWLRESYKVGKQTPIADQDT
jgi:hypothetical protein